MRPGAKVLGIGGVDVRNVGAPPTQPNPSDSSILRLTCPPQFDNLKAAADRCVKELGGIDFVIAGAAGNFIAPIAGLSPNAFKAVMDIDTIGTFNTVKATIPYLVESAARNPNPNPSGQTGGRFLSVSATFHYTGMPLQSHVSAAKAAIDSLMGSVSLEYGPYGVTANTVVPGAIAGTEGMERLASSELTAADYAKGVPIGRWGTVRDVADATVFVFSDAGNYVTGTNLVVDGAGWRRQGAVGVGIDSHMTYPNFLLTGEISKNLKDGRGSKSKL